MDELIERYFTTGDGRIWRRIVLSTGREVDTVMGVAEPRAGETLDERADRAYLTSKRRQEWEGGRSTVRVFDLYSGCGGLSLGLAEACRATGRVFKSAGAVDLDEAVLDIYAENFPGAFVIHADARALIAGPFRSRMTSQERCLRRLAARVDFLLAGPPCQGFSALNNHTRGNDPKNRLYDRVARAAEVLEPEHVLVENVAWLHAYSPAAVARTVEKLERLGYIVHEAVVPLIDLGVPQLRRRHILLGTRARGVRLDRVVEAFRRRPRSLRWAIGDLACGRPVNDFDRPSQPSPENKRRMAYMRRNRCWNLPNFLRPSCHSKGDHNYKSMYGRLRWNHPAQTITSGYGSMGQGRFVHPNGRRTLTPHEAARLQFFPDWFDLGKRTRTAWATAVGNAVPMKLTYVLGAWLLR